MSRISVPKLEVIHFSAEDIIVTSGAGGSGGTTGSTYYAFIQDIPYYTSGMEINESNNKTVVNAGNYYFFTPEENGNTFLYNKDNKAYNINGVDTDKYYYAWFDSIWYSDYNSNTYSSN